MTALLRRLCEEETGASMAEYALLLAIAGVTLIAAIRSFSEPIGDTFNRSASGMTAR